MKKYHAAFSFGNWNLVSWMIVVNEKLQKQLGCGHRKLSKWEMEMLVSLELR